MILSDKSDIFLAANASVVPEDKQSLHKQEHRKSITSEAKSLNTTKHPLNKIMAL